MEKLNFFIVDKDYVSYLQKAEMDARGFTRIPNMDYSPSLKQKFLCGIVLEVAGTDYYVPVSSFKQQKPDNFLILAQNGKVVSSLRFNYMFPVPKEMVFIRSIKNEPDRVYRALLSQELRYCIDNQEKIRHLAHRTYKRVLLGKDKGLVFNSCSFKLLEEKCIEYCRLNMIKNEPNKPLSLKDKLEEKKAECGRINAERAAGHPEPAKKDRDR